MIKIGIIGGAGYTAGELLRILVHHEKVEIAFVHSTSNAGKLISDVHSDLIDDISIEFSDSIHYKIDVLFFCQGHGKSKTFMEENIIPDHVRIIDLSHDFRLTRKGNDFTYGLPELQKDEIKKATKIANPGCFATAIQLGILPLAASYLVEDEIHVQAITGSTGAGVLPSATTHFSWRNSNISAYKVFDHQHLDEIIQSVKTLQPTFDQNLNFVPIRGNFTRGIFASMYTKYEGSENEAYEIFEKYYENHPFTIISKANPDLKRVVNTNKCIIHLQKHGEYLYIVSIIDNLTKGASGQAIQNMNLMMGFEETEGLMLKSVAF